MQQVFFPMQHFSSWSNSATYFAAHLGTPNTPLSTRGISAPYVITDFFRVFGTPS